MSLISGSVKKMSVALIGGNVEYTLPLGEQKLALNSLIGQKLIIQSLGKIECINCGRKTNKSFNQGHCYPCFKKLARCDVCIMSPEKCHFHLGTCREPDWGESFCMTDHIVYLANSSGAKVGITRINQLPTRWIDQGATQALPIFRVATRQQSGLVEHIFKQHIADKTNWRAMLKGEPEPLDLATIADELLAKCAAEITELQNQHGVQAIQRLENQSATQIAYPVLEYPVKVTSFNLDKNPLVEGTLMGIKGQYLIFDTGVINIRKYTAYHISVTY